MEERRIGLLGGTFNPIHKGHLHIANAVSGLLSLTQVLFIPVGHPPHKDPASLLPASDRFKMLALALSTKINFVACDIEIRKPSISYTVDTVRTLKNRSPEDRFFFIVGVDAFAQLETWKTPDVLLRLCDFTVISRPGFPFSKLPALRLLPGLDYARLEQLDAGKVRTYSFPVASQTNCHFLNIPHSEVSASEIRRRIATGKTLKNLLPHPVQSYIIEHNFYKGSSD